MEDISWKQKLKQTFIFMLARRATASRTRFLCFAVVVIVVVIAVVIVVLIVVVM